MKNRQQKIQELFEQFQTLRKGITPPHVSGDGQGITMSQMRAFFLIEAKSGCTVKEIAETLKITSSAATQLVDGLVAIGYIVRKESSKDRRVAMLNLTRKAINQHQRMKKIMFGQLLRLFKGLNDKELDQYTRLTKKISASLSDRKIQ
jgi:DNA-binding MarR family transcriptional regulator